MRHCPRRGGDSSSSPADETTRRSVTARAGRGAGSHPQGRCACPSTHRSHGGDCSRQCHRCCRRCCSYSGRCLSHRPRRPNRPRRTGNRHLPAGNRHGRRSRKKCRRLRTPRRRRSRSLREGRGRRRTGSAGSGPGGRRQPRSLLCPSGLPRTRRPGHFMTRLGHRRRLGNHEGIVSPPNRSRRRCSSRNRLFDGRRRRHW